MTDLVLLRTVQGSRLYGLARPESDHDTYTVIAGKHRGRQRIAGPDDTLVIGVDQFLAQCAKGVPQALEAMFSPLAEPGPLNALRAGYRVAQPAFRETYRRTIRRFALDGLERDDLKRRRHALRLLVNFEEGLVRGRFNPTLSVEQVAWVRDTAMASDFETRVLRLLDRFPR